MELGTQSCHLKRFGVLVGTWLAATAAYADAPNATTQPAGTPAPTYALPPVTVTAERREQSLQDVPASVTVVDQDTIRDAQIENVNDAARYVPNLYIQQFSAPRLSFPFIRGIGSGQNSPAVTTYIDGVPQISFATSNIQLVDIDRLEFLRGPQGTLYGRNTLGGVINIYTRQPTNTFEADATVSGGTYNLQDYRGGVRGPIVADKAYFAVAGGYVNRDGYTSNTTTGQDLDNRNDTFGRFELRFTPTPAWDVRLTFNAEKDLDGDFPLYDLNSLRHDPFQVQHDYTGSAHRELEQAAINATYHGYAADFNSVTAIQSWSSAENTDLDESPADLLRRFNDENEDNYIEELRLFTPTDKPIVINPDFKIHYVSGVLLFATTDHQHIDNDTRSAALTAPLPAPLSSFEDARLNDYGIGAYGQATVTFWDKLDLIGGARVDYEHKNAKIDNFSSSTFVPGSTVNDSRDDVQVSPGFQADYHVNKDLMPYVSVQRGFKAGGFNPTAPSAANISFGPERSWSYEAGAKTTWLDQRLTLNADWFYIDWKQMQLDVPTGQPSQFFIDNVGSSHSTGFEVEGDYLVMEGLDVFAGVGFTHARFDHYIQSNGVSAAGNRLPQTPETTWNVGAQYSLKLQHGYRAYARAEVIGYGPQSYDASNVAGQGAYTLTNFRLGFGNEHWRIEGYVNNAFNTHYVPLAYQFPLAPSGYVGESGDPLTAGITVGYTY